jgi:hypothetical protein
MQRDRIRTRGPVGRRFSRPLPVVVLLRMRKLWPPCSACWRSQHAAGQQETRSHSEIEQVPQPPPAGVPRSARVSGPRAGCPTSRCGSRSTAGRYVPPRRGSLQRLPARPGAIARPADGGSARQLLDAGRTTGLRGVGHAPVVSPALREPADEVAVGEDALQPVVIRRRVLPPVGL